MYLKLPLINRLLKRGALFGLKFQLKSKVIILILFLFFAYGCASHHPVYHPKTRYPQQFPVRKYKKKKLPASAKPYKVNGRHYRPLISAGDFSQKGLASWYGRDFHGKKTANGETYNMYAMTAAHKTLPLGTWVRVYNLRNGKQAVVRINDRGPFVRNRIIDLSYKAAKKLGVVGPGTAPVKIVALGKSSNGSGSSAAASAPVKYIPVNYWKGNFTVQVGAFMDKNNAAKFKHKLAARYKHAHITRFSDFRGVFFRVRVGRYSNLDAAVKFSRELISAGAKQAFVVAE